MKTYWGLAFHPCHCVPSLTTATDSLFNAVHRHETSVPSRCSSCMWLGGTVRIQRGCSLVNELLTPAPLQFSGLYFLPLTLSQSMNHIKELLNGKWKTDLHSLKKLNFCFLHWKDFPLRIHIQQQSLRGNTSRYKQLATWRQLLFIWLNTNRQPGVEQKACYTMTL